MKSLKDSLNNSAIKKLHVIVHEYGVHGTTPEEKIRERRAKREISRIKRKENYLIIGEYNDISRVHPKMPPRSPNLKVLISGAYKKLCCMVHLGTLWKLGYNAEYNEKGCYDSHDIHDDG